MKKILSILLAVLILSSCCAAWATDGTAESTGAEAPFTFSTTDRDGNTVDSSIFADYALTMVNCWEPWCGPCKSEMPDLEELYQNYKDRGLMILGVHEYEEDVDEVLEATGVTYPILQSTDDFMAIIWQTGGYPTTFFVDSEGNIIRDDELNALANVAAYQSMLERYLNGEYDEYKDDPDFESTFEFLDAAAEDSTLLEETAREDAATEEVLPGFISGAISYEGWESIVLHLLDAADAGE